jgi:hypothetical protein
VQVPETSVALAFGLSAASPGQQPVYAFLPMRSYGLRFMVQGDWVVPSSRWGGPGGCAYAQGWLGLLLVLLLLVPLLVLVPLLGAPARV